MHQLRHLKSFLLTRLRFHNVFLFVRSVVSCGYGMVSCMERDFIIKIMQSTQWTITINLAILNLDISNIIGMKMWAWSPNHCFIYTGIHILSVILSQILQCLKKIYFSRVMFKKIRFVCMVHFLLTLTTCINVNNLKIIG